MHVSDIIFLASGTFRCIMNYETYRRDFYKTASTDFNIIFKSIITFRVVKARRNRFLVFAHVCRRGDVRTRKVFRVVRIFLRFSYLYEFDEKHLYFVSKFHTNRRRRKKDHTTTRSRHRGVYFWSRLTTEEHETNIFIIVREIYRIRFLITAVAP